MGVLSGVLLLKDVMWRGKPLQDSQNCELIQHPTGCSVVGGGKSAARTP
jgi:hypothetical protein